jgi:protein O-mannosyl-transferase
MKKAERKKKSLLTLATQTTGQQNEGSVSIKFNQKMIVGLIACFLTLSTAIIYSGVVENDFINYDDDIYVTANQNIHTGLTWKNIKWAFTATYANNWHPLTWLSHMLDIEMYGLNPTGHHITNLVFHVLCVLLLFGLFFYATNQILPSTLVALLFSLHPVHVESVAWISERKDVLSTLFWFSILWSYVYYSRRRNISRYLTVISLFALGLMAKPMLVTLPVTLLLFDIWPIQSFQRNWKTVKLLLLEKLPLFFMSTASSVITLVAQQEAIGTFGRVPLQFRVSNAIVSYYIYLKQCFWPFDLSIFYPYEQQRIHIVIICLLSLVIISGLLLWFGIRKRYLCMGWLWYLLTLIPVIGIIQAGEQSHADRYTYLPMVGVFVVISWGLNDLFSKLKHRKRFAIGLTFLIVVPALGIITTRQVKLWKDSITLFTHAIEVTRDNYLAYNNLGVAFEKSGRINEAIDLYEKALKVDSCYADANYNIAVAMVESNKIDDAIHYYKRVLEIRPDDLKAINNLAGAYFNKNEFASSISLLKKALSLAKASGKENMISDVTNNLKYMENRLTETQGKTGQ